MAEENDPLGSQVIGADYVMDANDNFNADRFDKLLTEQIRRVRVRKTQEKLQRAKTPEQKQKIMEQFNPWLNMPAATEEYLLNNELPAYKMPKGE